MTRIVKLLAVKTSRRVPWRVAADARPRRILTSTALVAAIAWFLWLPLSDVLAYPQRLSVLPNLETDAAAYDAFARDFAATWTLSSLPSKHPPGWMVALAAVYATVGHSYVAGKLVSWVALVLTVAVCAWLANRVYGKAAAAIAALLCASSPGLRAYVGTLQYEVLTAALFTLFLVMTATVLDAASRSALLRRAAFAGLVGAALVLTRETFVLVIPLAAVWLWWRLVSGPNRVNAFAVASILIAVAAAPPLAWSAAQTLHYERLILISEKGFKEFQLGNNPRANGTYNEPLAGIAEPAGVAFIAEHRLRAAQLVVRKTAYMFGVLRDGWNVPHPAIVWFWRATTGAVPLDVIAPIVRGGWLLVACVAALVVGSRTTWRQWWVLPASVAAIMAVHLVTLASYRFAVPLLPVLYVIASGVVAMLIRSAVGALRAPLPAAAFLLIMILAIAAQFRVWPLHVEFDAVDLDGLAAANVIDPTSGVLVRAADGPPGTRPIVLLADTYLPRGFLKVSATVRRTTSAPSATTAIGRLALLDLKGRPACAGDFIAMQVPADQFTTYWITCVLEQDGPATLAVFSLGQAGLAVGRLTLAWGGPSRAIE